MKFYIFNILLFLQLILNEIICSNVHVSILSQHKKQFPSLFFEAMEGIYLSSPENYWNLFQTVKEEIFEPDCLEYCQWDFLSSNIQILNESQLLNTTKKETKLLDSKNEKFMIEDLNFDSEIKNSIKTNEKVDLGILEWALSSRYYVPRLQLYQQEFSMFNQFNNSPILVCDDSIYLNFPERLKKLIPIILSNEILELYSHDHYIFRSINSNEINACILYGPYGFQVQEIYHEILNYIYSTKETQSSNNSGNNISFIFRPLLKANYSESIKVEEQNTQILDSLQGYLAELQIKNMEYKSIQSQDNHSESENFFHGVNFMLLKNNFPMLQSKITKFFENFSNRLNRERINIWELRDVGVQASQLISMEKELISKLTKLKNISQNFPDYQDTISSLKMSSKLKDKILKFQSKNSLQGGESLIYINGIEINLEKISLYTLYDIFNSELKLIKNYLNFWENDNSKIQLSKLNTFLYNRNNVKLQSPRLNIRNETNKDPKFVLYLNNIEKDNRYRMFPNDLRFLNIQSSGKFQFVKKNIFEAIFVIDITKWESINVIQGATALMNQGYPVRIGFIFVPSGLNSQIESNIVSESLEISSALYYIYNKYSKEMLLALLFQDIFPELWKTGKINIQRTIKSNPRFSGDSILSKSEHKKEFMNIYLELKRKNLIKLTNPLLIFNGNPETIKPNHPNIVFQEIISKINQEIPILKSLIEKEKLSNPSIDIQSLLLKNFLTINEYEEQIYAKKPLFLHSYESLNYENYINNQNSLTLFQDQNIEYSYDLCLNINNNLHINFLNELLKHISKDGENNKNIRIFHYGEALSDEGKNRLNLIIDIFEEIKSKDRIFDYSEIKINEKLFSTTKNNRNLNYNIINPFCSNWNRYIQTFGNMKNGETFDKSDIIFQLNGRLFSVNSSFKSFSIIEKQELPFINFAKKLLNINPKAKLSIPLNQLISFISCDIQNYQRFPPYNIDENRNSINSCSDNIVFCIENLNSRLEYPLFHGVLNPLSETSPTFSQILYQLSKKFSIPMQIFLNPVIEYTSVPIQSWYRFNFEIELKFNNHKRQSNTLKFEDIKPGKSQILTLNIHTPETWLLSSIFAEYDLDNINLSNIKNKNLEAIYILQNIVITGACYDKESRNPVRGLQLFLDSPPDKIHLEDTLVMKNLGYFQLKANPGTQLVYISPGKHEELYEIHDYSITDFSQSHILNSLQNTNLQSKYVKINIAHYEGPFIYLQVKKTQAQGDLYDVSSGVWNSMKKVFSKNEETVNIFSVASGHLYERLMRIMMLSVVRNTKKSKVKFWILGNYLSPQFKDSLPKLAKKYDFEYGIVTYKWPTWLFKQKEKQRLIWAYKILFLDVLFPLNVKRIIFVDADQVCRTDMTELAELDIKNHAVAYTPFCSDKSEMDKYAFWKRGYWKNHLQEKPYHISALYLVDIQQMRKQSAADQYRSFYDSLARDPNSLSNLDQDLPNYAQHVVPIFSLPQEWLWCETWCSNKSKAKAKTIDLCNNPETKEHKIASAKRIISEWESYDNELQNLLNSNEENIKQIELNKKDEL